MLLHFYYKVVEGERECAKGHVQVSPDERAGWTHALEMSGNAAAAGIATASGPPGSSHRDHLGGDLAGLGASPAASGGFPRRVSGPTFSGGTGHARKMEEFFGSDRVGATLRMQQSEAAWDLQAPPSSGASAVFITGKLRDATANTAVERAVAEQVRVRDAVGKAGAIASGPRSRVVAVTDPAHGLGRRHTQRADHASEHGLAAEGCVVLG